MGAIGAAALGPCRNMPTATDDKKKGLLCFDCDFSGWYNIGKILKIIVATRCHILKLKCTQFDFVWGSVPDPAGSLQCLPDPLAGFKGPMLLREKKGRKESGGGRQAGATFRLVYTTPLLQHQTQLGLDPALPGAYKVTVSAVYQCDITLIELGFLYCVRI